MTENPISIFTNGRLQFEFFNVYTVLSLINAPVGVTFSKKKKGGCAIFMVLKTYKVCFLIQPSNLFR